MADLWLFGRKWDSGIGVVGTASYMSPDQACGRAVDYRSDQFCLGLVLYELLTGRKAFDKASAVQTLSAIIDEDPEPLERLSPKTPTPLVWIVARCLSKDPDERYAATRDLALELKQVRDNLARLTEGLPRPTGRAIPGAAAAETIRTGAASPSPTSVKPVAAPPRETRTHRAARLFATALGALALLLC